jgi:hypothetical protein
MSKKKKDETPSLEIHEIDINLINEAEYNPRKISAKKKKELRDSMVKFGIREALKVNTFPSRENVLISGHQRLKIAKELGFKKVPVTYEYVNLEDEKEMNLRWNKNGGEFALEKLAEVASRDKLLEIGFIDKELPKLFTEFEEEFNSIDKDDPVYPIIPKFDESYNTIMIFCKTEMDFNWLKNVLKIERKQDQRNGKVGECCVITAKEFQQIWKNKKS